jgi:hypothetical protein
MTGQQDEPLTRTDPITSLQRTGLPGAQAARMEFIEYFLYPCLILPPTEVKSVRFLIHS